MGLGLAGSSTKTKIGHDPRNTAWANDTDRFGHQQMLNMGWKPGQGLGKSMVGNTSHIKVKVKTDNVGLGRPKAADQPTGLDVFQRILGRLNGTEDKVEHEILERERKTGLYRHFVHGGILEGTLEKLALPKAMNVDAHPEPKKKRRYSVLEEIDGSVSDSGKSKDKKLSKKKSKTDKKDKKSKKEKKDKKEKKEKKSSTKSKPSVAAESEDDAKPSKKSKSKSKDERASKKSKSKKSSDEKKPSKKTKLMDEASEREGSPAPSGIRATRSRFIAMKRRATTDAQSLKEILMQT